MSEESKVDGEVKKMSYNSPFGKIKANIDRIKQVAAEEIRKRDEIIEALHAQIDLLEGQLEEANHQFDNLLAEYDDLVALYDRR